MIEQAIVDWDDAYENGAHIVDGSEYPSRWQAYSKEFRTLNEGQLDISYGTHSRQSIDLFLPGDGHSATARGLFVFIHGGYWQKSDKSFWSYLAKGALDAGWAVAMLSYRLCPDVSISMIQSDVVSGIVKAADQIDGPIILSGHSAGGHLVQCMMCADSGLPGYVTQRLSHVLSISGISDLRPLLNTRLNDNLQLDLPSAINGSPVFKQPLTTVPLTAWVGAGERAEFIRQNALIAMMWRGLGVRTQVVVEPDRHHFNVTDGLCDNNSQMMQAILSRFA